jgi:cytoskeletal protein RodZ
VDDARRLLREAADAHQPDREAMLARVEHGMSRPGADRARRYRRRRQASWVRAGLAGVAVVGMLGLGGLAVAAGVQHRAPQRTTPVVVPSSRDTAGATPKPRATAARPSVPSSTSASSASTASTHPAASAADGPISARGDVNVHSTVFWSQEDLTVAVAQPLTALTVELRIAQTSGVQNTGDWQTAPPDDFTVDVTQSGGFVVYRWTLKPGRTIPAAQQIFAAQFDHGTGKRDAGKDTFLVEAATSGHTSEVGGNFPAGG